MGDAAGYLGFGSGPPDAPEETRSPTHQHHAWFETVSVAVQEDWERLHQAAMADPQRAGHGGEATWVGLLESWLPPSYGIGTRKYILPEVEGGTPFETDIVIFNPGYPEALRSREEVLAGGIAAAFSVKLTLNADGIRDAVQKAAELRQHLAVRYGSAREEILAPFPVGLLAHSHVWNGERSTPIDNIHNALGKFDQEYVQHPRETLDLVCVADLAAWSTTRMPYIPPAAAAYTPGASARELEQGFCMTAIVLSDPDKSPSPVAVFIAHLLARLSYADPTLRAMADGLRLTGTLGAGGGAQRRWDLDDVFSDRVRQQLPQRGLQQTETDWLAAYT